MSTEPEPRLISRRRLLRGAALLPFGGLLLSCSSSSAPASDEDTGAVSNRTEASASPAPSPTPEPPFVVQAGEQTRQLMLDTPEQTPLYVFGSGQPGPVVMALGGVHGNEPGGWQAAEFVADRIRPTVGALLVVPRANRLAINLFARTTDDLGDLNRLYPGDPDGRPMERMAAEIVQALRDFHVSVLVDMHESWAFYKDRPQNGTAFLGQTVATRPDDERAALARGVVEAVNQRIQAPREEFSFREFPPNRSLPGATSALPFDTSGNPNAAVSGGSRSSLGLPVHIPGLTAILVEMGQQQPLERRVALHVDVFTEVLRRTGAIA